MTDLNIQGYLNESLLQSFVWLGRREGLLSCGVGGNSIFFLGLGFAQHDLLLAFWVCVNRSFKV